MSSQDRAQLKTGLRHNFPAFIHQCLLTVSPGDDFVSNWHIDAMAHHLIECAEGPVTRLAITVPPRHLKSTCASVALIAWLLGRDPTRKIIVVSYSNELSEKFARDFRRIVNADWYRDVFPDMRADRDTDTEFVTTMGGGRFSTSIGGTLTGRGADLIIIDDPLKPSEAMSTTSREKVNEWYRTTLISRLNDKARDSIIIVMQRLHEDDLVGHVLVQAPNEWTHLDLPAIAQRDEDIPIGNEQYHQRSIDDVLDPSREPLPVLESIRAQLGSAIFSAQYLQRPVPFQGNHVKREWIQRYTTAPASGPNTQIIQSWDTAMKPGENNDWSVCTTWLIDGNRHYLVNVTRKRVNYPDLKRLVAQEAAQHSADTVLIEDMGSGTSLIQDLNSEGSICPIAYKPTMDKESRLIAQSAKIEAGQVLLPRDAAWLPAFEEEIFSFPRGRHDDQVDSTSQFLDWIGTRTAPVFNVDWGWDDPNDQHVPFPLHGRYGL